jgi:hypothetical protein
MIEKKVLDLDEPIIAFDFLTVKPLGKASSGALIQSVIAVAVESGLVKIFDVYGNLLLEASVN